MVITISRQYGSGGRELAQKVAEKLNIKLYDRQIIHLAAAQIGINDLSEENLRELENNVSPLSLGFIPFFNFGNHSGDLNNEVFINEAKAIRQLADDGDCVILGRCADFILADLPNHYSFFVCADDNYRTRRGLEVYDGKTLKELNEEDKKRANYYKHYTNQKWGDPENHDMIINTSKMTLDEAANVIVEYVKNK
ncbi:cytidylate kinase [Megamonas hypermegale]|jgi:cytidylate kinase|uniref:Cytidylate kinase n=1 Tax=Megamonas hypermegale TaxID=158847 RepID=A0A239U5K3_9FIRM|nr:cytidylate kinase-like family protein [Megamonas hypermegale]OUO40402.1 cytidylate kinase [Megamonas hypermegale]SNV05236.1 cytidylate kinase [Megamonas hypermegale]HJF85735.1 cytidylate kinase-like family protein [Megamonas hypermegale]